MALLPFLSLLAMAVALVPMLESSVHRSVVYWLLIPSLVAGILAAWSRFGFS